MIQPIIRPPSQAPGRSQYQAGKQGAAREESPALAPARAHENYLPSPESLSTLIRSAITALKGGLTWDRGSIINLKV